MSVCIRVLWCITIWFSLLYSSKVVGFFSVKFFFLFKIVTYQSIFTLIDYLYFLSKMLSATDFRASMFDIPPNVKISALTSL